jgi:hypothetical protein
VEQQEIQDQIDPVAQPTPDEIEDENSEAQKPHELTTNDSVMIKKEDQQKVTDSQEEEKKREDEPPVIDKDSDKDYKSCDSNHLED